jgi:hypothetical protein
MSTRFPSIKKIVLTITEQFVQLLIVPDGELQVTGDNTLLLVIPSSISSEFENLSSQVLENSSKVD